MIKEQIMHLHTLYEVIKSCTQDASLENVDLLNTIDDTIVYYVTEELDTAEGDNELFEEPLKDKLRQFARDFERFAGAAEGLYDQPNYAAALKALPEWADFKRTASDLLDAYKDYLLSLGILPGIIYKNGKIDSLYQEYLRQEANGAS